MRASSRLSGLTGVLLVDKPSGPSSHDVVREVRRASGERRCGHTGTLDPLATGLLVLCLGGATRLARFLTENDKAYRATIRFGYATDTYDRTGRAVGHVRDITLDPDELVAALSGFTGEREQLPPPFSAKRIAGRRSYDLARAGVPVQPEPVRVEIFDLRLVEVSGALGVVDVSVSRGTYIRSLAHDLGRALGCGAHVEELRRTRVGAFSVDRAWQMDRVHAVGSEIGSKLISPDEALVGLPALDVGAEGLEKLRHGRPLPLSELQAEEPERLVPGATCRLRQPPGQLLAVGRLDADMREVRPIVVLQAHRT